MTHDTAPKLLTVGEIAYRFEIPVHRVLYVVRTRPNIRPAAFAGRTRLFDRETMLRIQHELNAIDARMSALDSEGGGHV